MENTNFKVYIEKKSQEHGCLYIEPLERGYGDTLGNALRRLLLSSIRGVAVTAVKIVGVLHEFSTIPGVREDVIEILMNLKHIPIKAKKQKPQLKPEGYKLLTIDSDDLPKSFFTREENPGVITAKDLPWDSDFEFCGDGVLCTLEPGAHLLMEIYIEPGVGYLSAERERPAHLPIDALLTDAIFSPVKRVNYQIETARVGQSIDYERLILEVWTNGAISPEGAVEEAASIAKNYFGNVAENLKSSPIFIVDDGKGTGAEGNSVTKGRIEGNRNNINDPSPIHTLELSLRSENCLLRVGIETVGQLLQRSHDDLLKIRNLGKKSLVEIEEKLVSRGLELSPSPLPQEAEALDKTTETLPDFSSPKEPDVLIDEIMNGVEGNKVLPVEPEEDKPKAKKTSTAKSPKKTAADKDKVSAPKKASATKSKTKKAAEATKAEVADDSEQAEKPKKPKKTTKATKKTKETQEEPKAEAPTETNEDNNQ